MVLCQSPARERRRSSTPYRGRISKKSQTALEAMFHTDRKGRLWAAHMHYLWQRAWQGYHIDMLT